MPKTHGLLLEARAAGYDRYFTGQPCKNGHIAERRVVDRGCVECAKIKSNKHYHQNHDKRLARQRDWQRENRQTTRAATVRWKKNNPEKVKEYREGYRRENREAIYARSAERRGVKGRSIPAWLGGEHRRQIREIYAEAKLLTECTGIKYEVDHIVPLKGANVSGLHVPWNLRVVTKSVNARKWRKLDDEAHKVAFLSLFM